MNMIKINLEEVIDSKLKNELSSLLLGWYLEFIRKSLELC